MSDLVPPAFPAGCGLLLYDCEHLDDPPSVGHRCGPVAPIDARVRRHREGRLDSPGGHRVEDRCCGLIGYTNGAVGVIENELSGKYGVGASIYGTEGMMEVNGNALKYMAKDTAGWQAFDPPDVGQSGYGDAFVHQAYGIVDWIEGKVEDYRCTGAQGKAALEIMMAVYESARVHERVQLPLQIRANPLDTAVEEGRIPVERPGWYDERDFLVRGEEMSWLPPRA